MLEAVRTFDVHPMHSVVQVSTVFLEVYVVLNLYLRTQNPVVFARWMQIVVERINVSPFPEEKNVVPNHVQSITSVLRDTFAVML